MEFMKRDMSGSNPYQQLLSSQMSVQSSLNKEKVRQWIRSEAKGLMEGYFRAQDENSSAAHPGLNVLTRLSQVAEEMQALDVDLGSKPLEELRSTVFESDVSAFEILHSGLIGALITYLTERLGTPGRDKRLKRFCDVFLNVKDTKSKGMRVRVDTDAPPALSRMVAKLNLCLNQIEQFPVKVHELPGGPQGALRGASALRFFHTHQIKCLLRRHPGCKELKEWHRGPIKVDPLAQISAIERYMVVKGYGRIRANQEASEDDSSDEGGSDDDIEEALSMGAILSGQHRIQFLIHEKVLPYDMTLYQAVRQFGLNPHGHSTDTDTDSEMSSLGYAAIWVNTHTLWYRLLNDEDESGNNNSKNAASGKNSTLKISNNSPDSKSRKSPGGKDKKSPKSSDPLWQDGSVPERSNPLSAYLVSKLSTPLEDPAIECLTLLHILYGINRYWWTLYPDQPVPTYAPIVPPTEFVNSKLAAKVNRQLQDPLTVLSQQIPVWIRHLAYACPFILPFESRQSLFYAVAFDRDRALQRLLDTVPDLGNQTEAGGERIAPRLERRKVVFNRDDLLKQAEQVFGNMEGSSRAVLEVQYQNEEGTGLGPTLEFFALVSKEVQRYKLELWRGEKMETRSNSGTLEDYAFSGQGLYAAPLARNVKQGAVSKIKAKFLFIGRLLARTLMDSRMLDLPLSPVFYKWLLGQEQTLCIADLAQIDPTMLRSLHTLMAPEGGSKEIEALDLDFTLPGFPSIELKKGGKDTAVTVENVHQYVKLVVHWMLSEGVGRQMETVVEGFDKIVPVKLLKMFYPEEMEQLFCGSHSDSGPGQGHWDPSVLQQHIRPDHGYTHDSEPVQWLVQIMASFKPAEQRRFLHFITGSPKLPVGGFKSLNPPLTVVRKGAGEANPDQYLPSVMTCVNYLKLPEYSSIQVMRERLNAAMNWGQRSFHLS